MTQTKGDYDPTVHHAKTSCRVCGVWRCKTDHPQWPCVKCKRVKRKKEFYLVPRPGRVSRRAARCRQCLAKEASVRLYEAGPDQERIRRASLKRRYNITLEQYESLLAKQLGACAICGRPPRNAAWLSVDHDHECCPGETSCGACVRGLLCRPCNSSLAMMDDQPERLIAAAQYLVRAMVTVCA